MFGGEAFESQASAPELKTDKSRGVITEHDDV